MPIWNIVYIHTHTNVDILVSMQIIQIYNTYVDVLI